jgi:hypothetical protein
MSPQHNRASFLFRHRISGHPLDTDTNFLFQIAGDKSFSLFNQNDRTLLPEDELERYHAGDANGALFKPDRQNDAKTYDLRAGFGIQIPSTAPHWAQNGDGVSVARSSTMICVQCSGAPGSML